jgi:hypothetical protein
LGYKKVLQLIPRKQRKTDTQLACTIARMISLSEFLLQGPIGTLVGTTAIATKHEDVAFVEDLGFGTCGVLVSPSIRCRASDCPRSAANLEEGFWIQHHYLTSFFGDPCELLASLKSRFL